MDDEHSPNLDFDADNGSESDSDSDAERYDEWIHYPSRMYPFEVVLDGYVIEIPDEGAHRVIDLFIRRRDSGRDVDEERADEDLGDEGIDDNSESSAVPSPYPPSDTDS